MYSEQICFVYRGASCSPISWGREDTTSGVRPLGRTNHADTLATGRFEKERIKCVRKEEEDGVCVFDQVIYFYAQLMHEFKSRVYSIYIAVTRVIRMRMKFLITMSITINKKVKWRPPQTVRLMTARSTWAAMKNTMNSRPKIAVNQQKAVVVSTWWCGESVHAVAARSRGESIHAVAVSLRGESSDAVAVSRWGEPGHFSSFAVVLWCSVVVDHFCEVNHKVVAQVISTELMAMKQVVTRVAQVSSTEQAMKPARTQNQGKWNCNTKHMHGDGLHERVRPVCSIFFSAKECLDETLSELELSDDEEVMEQLNK